MHTDAIFHLIFSCLLQCYFLFALANARLKVNFGPLHSQIVSLSPSLGGGGGVGGGGGGEQRDRHSLICS